MNTFIGLLRAVNVAGPARGAIERQNLSCGTRTWQYAHMTEDASSTLLGEALLAAALSATAQRHLTVSEWIETATTKCKSPFRSTIERAAEQVFTLSEDSWRSVERALTRISLTEYLSQNALSCETPARRKATGSVYTPMQLARGITGAALCQWRALNPNTEYPAAAADLSAGSGVFLQALHDVAPHTRILGTDINHGSLFRAELLRLTLSADWELQVADSLLQFPPNRTLFAPQSTVEFDLLVGNPPYVRSPNLASSYAAQLRNCYSSLSNGNFDLSVAFLEQALSTLRPNGVVSYIVSSKFSQAKYGAEIRRRLSTDNRVISIRHFGDAQVFEGVITYVLILTVAKAPPTPTFAVSFSDPKTAEHLVTWDERSTNILRQSHWDLDTDEDSDIYAALTLSHHQLADHVIGEIVQGVRTGANPVFLVTPDSAVEKGITCPYVSGREIDRHLLDLTSWRLIFPYETKEGTIEPLPEELIASRFPAAYAHLLRHRAILEERSIDQGSPWYSYSRSQSLSVHRLPKIFIKEMMARAEFAADPNGGIAFSSGYAYCAEKLTAAEIHAWTTVLNSAPVEFALRHLGTELHSGWFRVMKHQLRRLKLPRFEKSAWAKLIEIGNLLSRSSDEGDSSQRLALEQIANDVVAQAYGLSAAQLGRVEKKLRDVHLRSRARALSSQRMLPDRPRVRDFSHIHRERFDLQHLVTFKPAKKLPVHRWFPYTQGFSPQLVRELAADMRIPLQERCHVLDPFGGVGTTGLVCRQLGVSSVSTEISPLACWIAETKNTPIDTSAARRFLSQIDIDKAQESGSEHHEPLIFADFFATAYAPEILKKVRALLAYIDSHAPDRATADFLRLMLIGRLESLSNIRKHGSHYRYLNSETSVGLHKLNIPIAAADTNVGQVWIDECRAGLADLDASRYTLPPSAMKVLNRDARDTGLPGESFDAVITSPPYLNRNNYIAQQKAELALLGLVEDRSAYTRLVKSTLTSHVEATLPSRPYSPIPAVNALVEEVSARQNNNPKIPHMIAGYFDDLERVLREMWRVCAPSAKLAFIVGNARWEGVVIPVDHLLLQIAEQIGFVANKIYISRFKGNSPQQMRRYGRVAVRESIVFFEKPSR